MAEDPYLWLEDITGDDALDWVRKHNEPTLAEFGGTRFEQMRTEALEILDTEARIPYVRRRGDYLYNFWRDAANPRGLWRRTTLDSYRTEEPDWDVIIDVDALADTEDENWVWAGADVLEPELSLALIELSRGGADATVVREFDMEKRQFVTDGFALPEAKSGISWQDRDTVLVGTEFDSDSMTDSGYPRIVKRWKRGQPLDDAQTLFEGETSDVSVGCGYDPTPGFERLFITRAFDFFNRDRYELRGDELIRIEVPTDAGMSVHREWLLIRPRTEWTVGAVSYPAGSLLAANYDQFLSGTAELSVVFEPDAHSSLENYAWSRDHLVLVTLVDVSSHVELVTPGTWERAPIPGVPPNTNTVLVAIDEYGDEIFLDSSGFETPSRLLWGHAGGEMTEIKRRTGFLRCRRHRGHSALRRVGRRHHDPLFRRGTSRHDQAPGPTLLCGYGGFEVANTPG